MTNQLQHADVVLMDFATHTCWIRFLTAVSSALSLRWCLGQQLNPPFRTAVEVPKGARRLLSGGAWGSNSNPYSHWPRNSQRGLAGGRI